MKVLVFSGYYFPGYKGGGPIKTIKNLFDQVGGEIDFKLITSDRDLGDSAPYTSVTGGAWNQVGNASVLYAQPGKTGYSQITRQLWAKNYDAVYLNSLFSLRFSFFPLLVARALRQKIVLAPRGELSEGALSLKSTKKYVFIKVFKLLGLHRGTVFQASSNYEAEDIRRAMGMNVDIQEAENIGAKEFAERLVPRISGPLNVVFVSRISPKKNLLTAIEILGKVQQPLSFDIYGPVEDKDYWAECKKAIDALPGYIQVLHKGVIDPDCMIKTLADYDVFFFPTKGENYGHVIAEALCAGLPVVISDTTPWRNLQSLGIGWDFPLSNRDAFCAALDELATKSSEDHLHMRQNVLAWAKTRFSERKAIEANVALFKYVYAKK